MASYRHTHDHSYTSNILSIDLHAQSSKFNKVSPLLKLCFSIALLLLCIAADSAAIGLIIALSMLCILVVYGDIHFRYVLSLMKVPILFIMISCVTILVNFSHEPLGFLDIPLFEVYISITSSSISQSGTLFFKAYGTISALYLLCLTTPTHDLIHVLKKCHMREIIIELIHLTYCFIFVLIDLQNKMTIAAQSRTGFVSYNTAW